jgi:hypothetical protein
MIHKSAVKAQLESYSESAIHTRQSISNQPSQAGAASAFANDHLAKG